MARNQRLKTADFFYKYIENKRVYVRLVVMKGVKEHLTPDKMRELFGLEYQFMNWFDYDTFLLNDGTVVSNRDSATYRGFRGILKNDVRFDNYCELVAVVSLSITPYPYSNSPFVGQIVRRPKYVKPNNNFLGETGFAGTIVCRDKKTGQILPVPNKWLYTSTSHCIIPERTKMNGLPGLANLIESDVFCQDYETYEKLIRIHVSERYR